MLRYVGVGKRFFGDHPMPAHKRMNWEFKAVLRGKLSPFNLVESQSLSTNTLWLFPPGRVHGWRGDKGRDCEVFVAHFSSVPAPLESLAEKHGYLEIKLQSADKARIKRFARILNAHYWHPTFGSDVHTGKVLMELGLMLLKHYEETSKPVDLGPAFSKVAAAEDWLRTRLRHSPKITAAAKVVGLSISQLNRLFFKVRGESPKQFFTRAKLSRAMRLLARGNMKLEAVAGQSGFSSATSLCRTFKSEKGCSPTQWRRETLIKYRKPTFDTHDDPVMHGRRDRRSF